MGFFEYLSQGLRIGSAFIGEQALLGDVVVIQGIDIGLISIGDVVKQVIEDQKFSISQLERYVNGEAY